MKRTQPLFFLSRVLMADISYLYKTHIEPSGGASGQASDIALHAKEILRIRAALTDIYASHCTRPDEETSKARDRFGEFRSRLIDFRSSMSLMIYWLADSLTD